MAVVQILALSPGLPRTDIAAHALGGVEDARQFLNRLFPSRVAGSLGTSDVLTGCEPTVGRTSAGTYGPTTLVGGSELMEVVDLRSSVAPHRDGRMIFRLQLNGDLDLVSLEILDSSGMPVREVLLVGGEGVSFDSGPRLDFEESFWAGNRDTGARNAADPSSAEMPFDVQDYGEAALRSLFGFEIRPERAASNVDAPSVDPRTVLVHSFATHTDPHQRSTRHSPAAAVRETPVEESRPGNRQPSVADPPATAGEWQDSEQEPTNWWRRIKRQLFPD